MVAALLHSWVAWKFALAGLALYAGDKLDCAAWLLSQWRGRSVRLVSLRELPGGVLALRLRSAAAPSPGTAVRLLVPAISRWQWHPFTVSDTGAGGGADSGGEGGVGGASAPLHCSPLPPSTVWTLHVKATGSRRRTSRCKTACTLLDDRAPSAFPDRLKARLAPTTPRRAASAARRRGVASGARLRLLSR